ncbi:hypothetical protein TIFTF001_032771 [Ficus carica]|uniref:Uncharacterized protein n=1 Tax=Ficus carica TaxID=3494 RepID=A0AA88E0V3_FICCA|nr:hypothetical protein TIFTF001_032771 [Ficus carica]
MPYANEVPPQDNLLPLEVPPALVTPAGAQANPPMVREDLLYERFRRMKAPEFEGPTNPIEANNWLWILWDSQRQGDEAQIFKAKKEERAMLKQSQHKHNQDIHLKGQTSNSDQNSKQFGSNKRKGNVYNQGQQRNYLQKKNNQANGGNNYPICAKCGKKHLGAELYLQVVLRSWFIAQRGTTTGYTPVNINHDILNWYPI